MSIIICNLETTIPIYNIDARRSSLRLTHLGIMVFKGKDGGGHEFMLSH
jgi:hypothetical protein